MCVSSEESQNCLPTPAGAADQIRMVAHWCSSDQLIKKKIIELSPRLWCAALLLGLGMAVATPQMMLSIGMVDKPTPYPTCLKYKTDALPLRWSDWIPVFIPNHLWLAFLSQ